MQLASKIMNIVKQSCKEQDRKPVIGGVHGDHIVQSRSQKLTLAVRMHGPYEHSGNL